jgi:chromosome segregation ATPase
VLELTRPLRTPDLEERLVKAVDERASRLEREKAALAGEAAFLRQQAEETARDAGRLHEELRLGHEESASLRSQLEARSREVRELEAELARHREEVARLDAHLKAAYGEIHRLNTTLALIYASRTWKLHAWLQRVKRLAGMA